MVQVKHFCGLAPILLRWVSSMSQVWILISAAAHRTARVLLGIGLIAALGGCAEMSYYLQSIQGHTRLLLAAEPIDRLLLTPSTSSALRDRLRMAQRLRRYASEELSLPENTSYQRYADLGRSHVVWNVVAAPAYSLKLKTWCFPVMGCVAYRGYFEQEAAQQFAAQLRSQGLEVEVYGVPAYSTLGWMNWLGGDPLLNTWANYGDADLAKLMFHELAHQVLYVGSDTVFDESFATAVARLGTLQWLRQQSNPQLQLEFERLESRRASFRALTRSVRASLAQVYEGAEQSNAASDELARAKTRVFEQFRHDYAVLKTTWGGDGSYDAWVQQANNASLGAQAAYDDLVGGFEALFDSVGRRWPDFFKAAKALAQKPQSERTKALQHLAAGAG